MRMIDKIIRAMQDTGLADGMSVEDCDTLATAALEAMREPDRKMVMNGYYNLTRGHQQVYTAMIDAALEE